MMMASICFLFSGETSFTAYCISATIHNTFLGYFFGKKAMSMHRYTKGKTAGHEIGHTKAGLQVWKPHPWQVPIL
jgi:hypothetical protein